MPSRSFGRLRQLGAIALFLCAPTTGLMAAASGSGNSSAAPLVLATTTILQQPVSQQLKAGETATFSVTASGTGLIYMWFFNGVALPGQNGPTLLVANVTPANVGLYFAQIIDQSGQVAAQTEIVNLTLPSPDIVITSAPATVKVALDAPAAFFVSVTAPTPVSYQWLHDGKIIPGATQPFVIIPRTLQADAGSYVVRVTTTSAGVISPTANLTYAAGNALVITTPPRSQAASRGETVQFEISVSAPGPVSYIWRSENGRVSGITSPVLTLHDVQPTDAGEYWVAIANGTDGTTVFASAVLTVLWLDMSAIPDIALRENAASDPTPIHLSGDSQSLDKADLTVLSSNPALLSAENVFFGGSGADRFMVVFAKATSSGTARLTVSATSGGQTASAGLNVSVLGNNTPPVIANLPQAVTAVLHQIQYIPFQVSDAESPSTALQIEAKVLGPAGAGFAQVTGTGTDRVLTVTAVSPQGTSLAVLITVQDDGGATVEQTLTLTLTAPSVQISRDGPELVISYADTGSGGTIEYRYDLGPNHSWQTFGYVPTANGDQKLVRIPLPASDIFFRLRY